MKICLFSPYIPKHFGGGERYLFDVGLSLLKKHQVSIAIPYLKNEDESEIRRKYEAFLGTSLSKISFVSTPIGTNKNFLSKLLWTKQWDIFYHLTDGSLIFSLAKKNILHIQFPIRLNKSGLVDKLKIANYSVVNTNSEFTKKIVSTSWPIKVDVVHYPRITITAPSNQADLLENKEKVILNVGRFFRQLHSKRQDVLVKIFQDLVTKKPQLMKGWKLVLIGSVEDAQYAREVAAAAENFPIEILHSVSRSELLAWYQKAAVYWHATGFDIDETKDPEKVEHFGITTAEAMSLGAAPVVLAKGGQPEVLGKDLSQLLWNSVEECLLITSQLIENPDELKTEQLSSIERAKVFSGQLFDSTLQSMIE